mgnify:CR=1 FL=1
MQVIRLGGSMLLGLIIAFALFMLMSALIDMGDLTLDQDKGVKIADFNMPDTDIEAKLDEELPDEPDEVEAPPPELEAQDIEIDSPDNALNVNAGAGKFNPEIGLQGGFSRDTDFIPIYVKANHAILQYLEVVFDT